MKGTLITDFMKKHKESLKDDSYAYVIRYSGKYYVPEKLWYLYDVYQKLDSGSITNKVVWMPRISQALFFPSEELVESVKADIVHPRKVDIERVDRRSINDRSIQLLS